MYLMKSYDDALQQILEHGTYRTNKRTNIRTKSIFGLTTRYRLDTGFFPLLTRRKIWPKSVFSELLWFLSGSTSNKDLKNLGCNFWSPWVDHEWEKKNGFAEETFGPVYGFQLRHFGGLYGNGVGGRPHSDKTISEKNDCDQAGNPLFKTTERTDIIPEEGQSMYGLGGFDQLKWVVDRIREDHSCRRTLWTLWNPNDVAKMRLPPCHMLFQILVDDERRMTGILYQRSCDYPIGIPANIQFYSALTTMLAQQTDCQAHEFVHVGADAHIYEDQLDAVRQYLETPVIDSPVVSINKAKDIFSYKVEDFVISNFATGPKIHIPVAV